MNTKTARILCYCTLIGWLIALLAFKGDRNEISKDLTQGIILMICGCIPVVNFVVLVFVIIALVKIIKDEDSSLPLIGGIDWFAK